MKHHVFAIPLGAALLVPQWAAAAKKPEEPGITRQQADAILNELRQIRQLLEKVTARAAAAPQGPEAGGKAALALGTDPMLGNKDAPVTMVEFTDYQCSFCQRFHLATFPEIRKKYIDTGKVRFVSRDFPLDFHSNAFRAAEAARCAGDQGQFWQLRDLLVANANKLSPEEISKFAESLKLDMAAFRSCLDGGKHKDAIEKAMTDASAMNISGTPSFVIGRTTPEGVDGVVVVGALPLAAFEAKFREAESAK